MSVSDNFVGTVLPEQPAPFADFIGTGITTKSVFSPCFRSILMYGYCPIFDPVNKYPIWDEKMRPWLEQRIIDHFYLRELGGETIEESLFYINRKMRENMPYINAVYTALNDPNFTLFGNVNMTEDRTEQGNVSGSSIDMVDTADNDAIDYTSNIDTHATNQTNATAVNSNTPQVNIPTPAAQNIEYYNTGDYTQTNSTSDTTTGRADHTANDRTIHTQNTGSTGEDTLINEIITRKGTNGVLGIEMIERWLQEYINPLNNLFAFLEPCFMQVWVDHTNGLF